MCAKIEETSFQESWEGLLLLSENAESELDDVLLECRCSDTLLSLMLLLLPLTWKSE